MTTPPFTAFPIPTLDFYNSLEKRVNVMTFGAVGDGAADDTAAIQAAIDYGFANNIRTIYLPDGRYKTTSPLYLDPPNNLRSNLANPPLFQFSASLVGAEGLGNDTNNGAVLKPTFNNTVALYVGPGNGMLVKNITIDGPIGSASYHRQQPAAGVGIGICGGQGGASRTRIENCAITHFYTSFKTGANGNVNLCDSNTFIKCWANTAAIGYWFAQIQNFINSLYDCQISNCPVGLVADVGTGANVYGGNWSGGNSAAHAWGISSISALTTINHGNYNTYRFSGTIPGATPSDWQSNLDNEIFDAFSFETTHFGIVPCTLVSFDSGTNLATFETTPAWSQYNWGSNDAKTASELETEIQANTKVWCCERMICFRGANIAVYGIHVENPLGATQLIDAFSGFGSNRPNTIKSAFMNFDPGLETLAPTHSPNDDNRCRYYAAKTFPFISVRNNDLEITDCEFGINDPVLVEVSSTYLFQIERIRNFWHNLVSWQPSDTFAPVDPVVPYGTSGVFDHLYFSGNFNGTYADHWRTDRGGASPSWGWRPAPWASPAITPADLATISGALPAINTNSVNYPLVWGGQPYSVSLVNAPTGVNYGKRFYSAHSFYSYGQDLTTTVIPALSWSYRGKSFAVYLNDQRMLFPGLGLVLNDGSSDILYVVTGCYPGLGYVTVQNASSFPFVVLNSGAKNATVTGSLIKQQAFAITVT